MNQDSRKNRQKRKTQKRRKENRAYFKKLKETKNENARKIPMAKVRKIQKGM